MFKNIRNSRGDTIIEVMIAILVLGMALSAAFAITNSSVKKTQANHERYQAQLYANKQAELLRTAYADHIKNDNRGNFTPSKAAGTGACLTACTNVDGLYTISVAQASSADANKLNALSNATTAISYTIKVTWPKLEGDGDYNVELVYGL